MIIVGFLVFMIVVDVDEVIVDIHDAILDTANILS